MPVSVRTMQRWPTPMLRQLARPSARASPARWRTSTRDVGLDAQHLGEPLVVDARRRHRRLRVQLPVDDVEQHLRRRRDDGRAARGARDDLHADRRRARWSASSTTAAACCGATAFCVAADEAERVGHARLHREVVHLVVEQDAGLARDDACAPNAEVHRRRQRHRVARRRRSRDRCVVPPSLVQRRRRARRAVRVARQHAVRLDARRELDGGRRRWSGARRRP